MSDDVELGAPPSRSRAPRVRWWQWMLPTVGGLALAAGVVLLAWVAAHPPSFGWFAYAPLSDTTFTTPGSGLPTAGRVLIVFGLVVVAFWAGLLVGPRTHR